MTPRQIDLLDAAFERGESLTALDALERFGVLALSQRCTDLRKLGKPVHAEIIRTHTGKHVARYSYREPIPFGGYL